MAQRKYKARKLSDYKRSGASQPEYMKSFYIDKGERQNTKRNIELREAVEFIGSHGVNISLSNLRKYGEPIMREAEKRLDKLEEAGLIDSPAYRGYIVSGASTSMDTTQQKLRHNVLEAFNFIHAKTSIVEEALNYNSWLDAHLGKETTTDERQAIWDVVHEFENKFGQAFEGYGYDEAIKKIAQVSRASGYNLGQLLDADAFVDGSPLREFMEEYLISRGTKRKDEQLREILAQFTVKHDKAPATDDEFEDRAVWGEKASL